MFCSSWYFLKPFLFTALPLPAPVDAASSCPRPGSTPGRYYRCLDPTFRQIQVPWEGAHISNFCKSSSGVLIFHGCYNKLPYTWRLNRTQIYSSTFLDARSLKWGSGSEVKVLSLPLEALGENLFLCISIFQKLSHVFTRGHILWPFLPLLQVSQCLFLLLAVRFPSAPSHRDTCDYV